MLTMSKMSLVTAATTLAILIGDYCYKQTLPRLGDAASASMQVAGSRG